MLIQIKHRSQSFAGRPATRISKFIDNLIITINLKFHGENYGCFKAGSTHFLKQSNLFSLSFFFFSLRSDMIDHQFSRYFTILQSKVTQITQIKVFEFRINTFHFIWTFYFTAHSCHSWVQPRDCFRRLSNNNNDIYYQGE